MYERVNDLKKLQPGLKTLLSFGGWTFSQGNLQLMSTLFASPENRHRFTQSAIDFVRKHNFDGFDMDFEYPSAKDKTNFGVLANEMKEAFEQESKQSGQPCLLLTAAVGAGYDKIDEGYDVPALAKAFDFLNVMTYDFHGAWDQVTGMNSPLYDRNSDRYSISDAMNYWAQKAAPKEKLILGFAAYGRGWTLRDQKSYQVGAPTNGPAQTLLYSREAGIGTYYEVCTFLESGANRYMDDRTKVPYLVKGNQWFGYDDAESYKTKLNWLKENGFGGAFTWALDMDDFTGQCKSSAGQKFPLHNLIRQALGDGKVTFPTETPQISTTARSTERSTGTTHHHGRPTTSRHHDEPTTSRHGPFTCPGPGIYPDPEHCEKFYLCDESGIAYSKTCPNGLRYNPAIKACDWPEHVQC